jgi:catechol 2,3-dioxygenase-like lactoylglutathione lyase family enzyme
MISALNRLDVITLFVQDVRKAKAFYLEVLGLDVIFEDDVSAVVRLRNLMINLLHVDEAPTLIEPRRVADGDAGSCFLLTIEVANANATCAELAQHGVGLLNGPIDRPWGRRTAAFADPDGNVWEIAQVLHGA